MLKTHSVWIKWHWRLNRVKYNRMSSLSWKMWLIVRSMFRHFSFIFIHSTSAYRLMCLCVCVFSGRPCRYVQIHIVYMIEYLYRLRSSLYSLFFVSISFFNPRHLIHIFFSLSLTVSISSHRYYQLIIWLITLIGMYRIHSIALDLSLVFFSLPLHLLLLLLVPFSSK